MPSNKIKVAVADDHKLLRKGLVNLIESFEGFEVIFEADNGKEFIEKIQSIGLPAIALLDINMPVMDGFELALWLKNNSPAVKVLALSMYDNESAIIRMLRNGARGYILKDIDPSEFKASLDAVHYKGFYYSEIVTGRLVHAVSQQNEDDKPLKLPVNLSEREIAFLKLVCTELTYKEIAEKLFVSPRTVDGYRDALLEKLGCKTRIGLVMFAIKNGMVEVQ